MASKQRFLGFGGFFKSSFIVFIWKSAQKEKSLCVPAQFEHLCGFNKWVLAFRFKAIWLISICGNSLVWGRKLGSGDVFPETVWSEQVSNDYDNMFTKYRCGSLMEVPLWGCLGVQELETVQFVFIFMSAVPSLVTSLTIVESLLFKMSMCIHKIII